jgi:hypothetical protein
MNTRLLHQLHDFFRSSGFEIHGAVGIEGIPLPPFITNDGYGSGKDRQPVFIGFDPVERRIVFGLIREKRSELDSEESLEEYNVFLDHNAGRGSQASAVYVIMPAELMTEFGDIVSHYVHREYWGRIVGVAGNSAGPRVTAEGHR